MVHRFVYVFGFFCALTHLSTLSAQTGSPPVPETVSRDSLQQNYQIEQEIRQFRQRPSEISIGSPQPPASLDTHSDEKIFELRGVIFDNLPHSISKEELDTIAARYISQENVGIRYQKSPNGGPPIATEYFSSQEKVSLRDLYKMLAEIDHLFDARHVLGRAVLPVQDIEGGIVHVQIIEGSFGTGKVNVKGTPVIPMLKKQDLISLQRPFEKRFIDKHFRFQPGSVANVKKLEEEILRFNRTYRTQLIAELEPGDELGESDLNLTAVVPQPVSGGWYTDNTGRESSGEIRNGYFVQIQDVMGWNESLYCSYDKTDGTSYLTVFGDLPISRYGTFFEMGYDYGTPKTIYGPLVDLNITGTSERYRPGIRQLIRNTQDRKTDISFQMESFESTTSFDGFVNYREKVTAFSLGLSDVYRTAKSMRVASLSWLTGNVDVYGDAALGGYHIMQAGLTKAWYPNKCWTFLVKSSGQWGGTLLSQSRIFQIGGMATVRGVTEGLMTGDSGYYINFEGRRQLFTYRNKLAVEAFGFFDHGGVYNRVVPLGERSVDYLYSVGIGLNMNWSRYVSATIGYGEPIFTSESHRADYRRQLHRGIGYFTVRAQF